MPTRIHQTVHREETLAHGRRLTIEFRADGAGVPAILLLPDAQQPVPAAVLLHGYGSRKEHMAEGVGTALLRHGIASLAIDLPLHGTRQDPLQMQAARNPLAIAKLWRQGLADAKLALGYLGARRETDRGRLALVGYSMGSFLGVQVAAQEAQVRAMVLAAGGDLPANTPFATLIRQIIDPHKAVRQLAGRPLLMVHGRHDRTVLPEQAERLYAAAREPKQLEWWDAGHILPPAAIEHAAAWLAERLGAAPPASS